MICFDRCYRSSSFFILNHYCYIQINHGHMMKVNNYFQRVLCIMLIAMNLHLNCKYAEKKHNSGQDKCKVLTIFPSTLRKNSKSWKLDIMIEATVLIIIEKRLFFM